MGRRLPVQVDPVVGDLVRLVETGISDNAIAGAEALAAAVSAELGIEYKSPGQRIALLRGVIVSFISKERMAAIAALEGRPSAVGFTIPAVGELLALPDENNLFGKLLSVRGIGRDSWQLMAVKNNGKMRRQLRANIWLRDQTVYSYKAVSGKAEAKLLQDFSSAFLAYVHENAIAIRRNLPDAHVAAIVSEPLEVGGEESTISEPESPRSFQQDTATGDLLVAPITMPEGCKLTDDQRAAVESLGKVDSESENESRSGDPAALPPLLKGTIIWLKRPSWVFTKWLIKELRKQYGPRQMRHLSYWFVGERFTFAVGACLLLATLWLVAHILPPVNSGYAQLLQGDRLNAFYAASSPIVMFTFAVVSPSKTRAWLLSVLLVAVVALPAALILEYHLEINEAQGVADRFARQVVVINGFGATCTALGPEKLSPQPVSCQMTGGRLHLKVAKVSVPLLGTYKEGTQFLQGDYYVETEIRNQYPLYPDWCGFVVNTSYGTVFIHTWGQHATEFLMGKDSAMPDDWPSGDRDFEGLPSSRLLPYLNNLLYSKLSWREDADWTKLALYRHGDETTLYVDDRVALQTGPDLTSDRVTLGVLSNDDPNLSSAIDCEFRYLAVYKSTP